MEGRDETGLKTTTATCEQKKERPSILYYSWVVPAPEIPSMSNGISPGDHIGDQYFGNILSCRDLHDHPLVPPYMATQLRTIIHHFSNPMCCITTDHLLSRSTYHLSCLPDNYPWIFMLEVLEDQGQGLRIISSRQFFRDLEGEIGSRPYVEITKVDMRLYILSRFEVEDFRTGMWHCASEEKSGHDEHWRRKYVVKFYKKKDEQTLFCFDPPIVHAAYK